MKLYVILYWRLKNYQYKQIFRIDEVFRQKEACGIIHARENSYEPSWLLLGSSERIR